MEIDEAEDRLLERLSSSRDSAQIHLEVLGSPQPSSLRDLAAVGFDTNILKALRREPPFAEQLLLTLSSNGVAVIAPGQSIVEYWNNHKVFASEEWNKFGGDLDRLIKHVDDENLVGHNQDAIDQIRGLVSEISADLQESKSPEFLDRSANLVRTLLETATMPRVSRPRFADLASVRMNSNTPPGFADGNNKVASWGDFFVWSDFLLGVLTAKVQEERTNYLWITDENKPDWKTGTTSHPFLLEEFQWVCGGHLSILSLAEVRKLFKSDEASALSAQQEASETSDDSDLVHEPMSSDGSEGVTADPD